MIISIRVFLAAAVLCFAASAHAQAPEKAKLVLAVGGKASLFYLPLSLTERLGYFKDEGLTVEIVDFPGGAKTLQALVGGSADVAAGGYEHTITMQSMGQKLKAFVLFGVNPGISLGVAKSFGTYTGAKDLKGKKVGVTAPGSSTNQMLNHLLNAAGLKPEDVSVIGVGTSQGAIAAVRGGQIDALVNVEPVMTILEKSGDLRIVAETTTVEGANAVFGGQVLAGCLYTKAQFVKDNPNTVQALTNAMVRTLKWLHGADAAKLAATVPQEYLMGDKADYLAAFERLKPTYSTDGLFSAKGVDRTHKVLAQHHEGVRNAQGLALDQTYDNSFVQKALAKYK